LTTDGCGCRCRRSCESRPSGTPMASRRPSAARAAWSFRHNCVPGTPGGRGFFGSGCGRGRGLRWVHVTLSEGVRRPSRRVPRTKGVVRCERRTWCLEGTLRLRDHGGRSAQGDRWDAVFGHCSGCGYGPGHGSLIPGLLGRISRPSVARAAWSFEEAGRSVTTLLGRAAASF